LLISAIIGISLKNRIFHTGADIKGAVYPTTLFVGDTLYYVDKTPFSSYREWFFGDGNVSMNDSGYYLYENPGYYQVTLTLNGKYSKSFPIQVKDRPQANIRDSVTTIEAPSQAMQFENIIFRADSKNAKLFSWKFGESGTIDSKEQMVIYAYQKPGKYTVTLYTDETEYPITHDIEILPSFKINNDSISVDDIYKKIDDDFKYHLQQIANGENFNVHYNYLLNKYLCKNANAVIKVNTSKINTFYYYCAGLQFDKNSIIQSAKVSYDENMNCVTKVDIVQSK
jgi:PKD repeat protein